MEKSIKDYIEKSCLTHNKIKQITGLSNSYIDFLIKGKIKKPGKNKVVFLSLGLNLNFDEINSLLKICEASELNADEDLKIFYEYIGRKHISGNQPVYSNLNATLQMIALEAENIEGSYKAVIKSPPKKLYPKGYARFINKIQGKSEDRGKIMEGLYSKRIAIFENDLNIGVQMEYIICENDLINYIRNKYAKNSEDIEHEKIYKKEHVLAMCEKMIEYDNFKLDITTNNSPFIIVIRQGITQNQEEVIRLIYLTQESDYTGETSELIGFSTDSKEHNAWFNKEYERHRGNIIHFDRTNDKIDYIKDLLEKHSEE